MWAAALIEADISPKGGSCLRSVAIGSQMDFLIFDSSPKAHDEDIVPPRAFTSMLILISRSAYTLINSIEVNWLPSCYTT